jgi:hypothetical protein
MKYENIDEKKLKRYLRNPPLLVIRKKIAKELLKLISEHVNEFLDKGKFLTSLALCKEYLSSTVTLSSLCEKYDFGYQAAETSIRRIYRALLRRDALKNGNLKETLKQVLLDDPHYLKLLTKETEEEAKLRHKKMFERQVISAKIIEQENQRLKLEEERRIYQIENMKINLERSLMWRQKIMDRLGERCTPADLAIVNTTIFHLKQALGYEESTEVRNDI